MPAQPQAATIETQQQKMPPPRPEKVQQPETGQPAVPGGPGKQETVRSGVKGKGYGQGATSLAPEQWKPAQPGGPSAVAEINEFLKGHPSAAEMGKFLSRLQNQGRIGPANATEIRQVIEKARGPEYAKEAMAFTGIATLTGGVKDAGGAAADKGAGAQPEAKGEKKGWTASVKGWFHAGAERVNQAWQNTKQAVGNAVDRTKGALKNTWDVLSTSGVGYADGKITAHTNLAELQDFLPGTKQMFDLDEKAAGGNRVDVVFDTKSKEMTIRSASLALTGMNFRGLTTGPATLTDVFVRITNPGHLKGGSMMISKANPTDMHIDVTVGGISAQRVSYQSPRGPIVFDSMNVSRLQFWLDNKGGKAPFTDATPDNITAGFTVGDVVLKGVNGGGISADSVAISKAAVSMDQTKETMDVSAGKISTAGASVNGNKVKEAEAMGLSAHFDNKGGGLVGMDSKQDTLVRAQIQVNGVNINQVQTATGASLGSATASGLSASVDKEKHEGSLSVASAGAANIEAGGSSVNQLSLSNLSASQNSKGVSGSAGAVNAQGVNVAGAGSVESLTARGLTGGRTTDGTISAGAKQIGARNIDMGTKGTARSLDVSNLNASVDKDRDFSGSASGIGVKGVHTSQVDVGSAGLGGLKVTGSAGPEKRLDASVASLEANNITTAQGYSVGGVSGQGLSAQTDFQGTYWANSKSLAAREIDLGKVKAQSAEVGGLSYAGGAKAGEVWVDSASARGIDAAGMGSAGGVDVTGFKGKYGEGGTGSATVKGIEASNLAAGGFRADSLAVGGASASAQGGQYSGGAETVGVSGAGYTGKDGKQASLQSGTLQNVAGGMNTATGQGNLSIGGGQLIGGSGGGASFERAGFENAGASMNAGGASVTVGKADVTNLNAANSKVGYGSASGIGVDVDKAGGSISGHANQLSASNISGQSIGGAYSLGQAGASGLSGAYNTKSQTVTAGVDKASGSNLAYNGVNVNTTVSQVGGENINVQSGPKQTHVDVGKAQASGIDFATHAPVRPAGPAGPATTPAGPSGPQTAPPKAPPIDLMKMSQQEIDHLKNADVRLSLPMIAGKYDNAKIDKGTTCEVYLSVKDGVIQPDGTRIVFSKPLDALLWTRAAGVYIEKDGTVKIDVRGFFDINISDKIAGSGHKQIPLKLSELMAVISERQAKATGGGGGAAPQAKPKTEKPKKPGKPSLTQSFDYANATGQATVGLGPGKIEAGGSSVTLGQGGPGTNQITATKNDQQEIVATFMQFLVSAFDIRLANTDVKGGEAQVSGGNVKINPAKAGGGTQVSGSIKQVTAQNVGVNQAK